MGRAQEIRDFPVRGAPAGATEAARSASSPGRSTSSSVRSVEDGESGGSVRGASLIHGLRLAITIGVAAAIVGVEAAVPAASWRAWLEVALFLPALLLVGETVRKGLSEIGCGAFGADGIIAAGALIPFLLGITVAVLASLGRLSPLAWDAGSPANLQGTAAPVLGLGAAAFLLSFPHMTAWASAVVPGLVRRRLERLRGVLPSTARTTGPGGAERAAVREIKEGARVAVDPGERIPVDGTVLEASGQIDGAFLGESVPASVLPGDRVFAGARNLGGLLLVHARSGAARSLESAIALAVRQPAAPPRRSAADGPLASAALAAAGCVGAAVYLLGGGYGASVTAAIGVLFVSCPGVAPLVASFCTGASVARALERGILIKGPAVLDILSRARTAIFTRTGTITAGRPRAADVVVLKGGTAVDEILFLAMVLEVRSEHPISDGIIGRQQSGFHKTIPEVRDFRAHPGEGLRGVFHGKQILFGGLAFLSANGVDGAPARSAHDALAARGLTPIVLALGGEIIGIVGMEDQMRSGAEEAVAQLRRCGLEPVLLSGDCPEAAGCMGRKLGIEDVRADLPQNSKAAEARSISEGRPPAISIGHRHSDSPILEAAHAGIVLESWDERILRSAGAVIFGTDLRGAAVAVKIARSASRRVRIFPAVAASSSVLSGIAVVAAMESGVPAGLAALGTAIFALVVSGATVVRTLRG
jgi:Cu+-exporting ATPase